MNTKHEAEKKRGKVRKKTKRKSSFSEEDRGEGVLSCSVEERHGSDEHDAYTHIQSS